RTAHGRLEGLGDGKEVVGLAHRHPGQLPPHRLLVHSRRGAGVEAVGDRVRHLVRLVDGVDARARLVAGIDARARAPARLELRIGFLVDPADLDEVGAGLDDVLEGGDAARAGQIVDAGGAALHEHATLHLLPEPQRVPRVLDAYGTVEVVGAVRDRLPHHLLVV